MVVNSKINLWNICYNTESYLKSTKKKKVEKLLVNETQSTLWFRGNRRVEPTFNIIANANANNKMI